MPAIRPKSGHKSKTSFKPGQSGNPSGRPKQTQEQKDALQAIRELAPTAAEKLREIIENPATEPRDRLRAIDMVLERTYGKADAHIELTQPDFTALHEAFAALQERAAHDGPQG